MIEKSLAIAGTVYLENPPDGLPPGRYVYQRVGAGLGNVPGQPNNDMQLRRHVVPADPQTPAQLARRAAFAAAVASWHTATQEQREAVRPLAERKAISLFNAWVSDHT